MLAVAGLLILLEFRNRTYNWDLDHEIYFGKQLLQGNLIWVTEFHDKLPILQMLFGLAATGDPLLNWRLISIFAVLISIFAVLHMLPRIYSETGGNLMEGKQLAILASALYLLVSVGMPWGGGLSHINVFASSMGMISLVSAYGFAKSLHGRFSPAFWLLVAALAATLCISVRPYFLAPLAVGYLWVVRLIFIASGNHPRESRIRVAFLLAAPAVLGLGANSFPYALGGNLSAFSDGLAFMSQPTRRPTVETFGNLLDAGDEINYLAVVLLVLACVVIFTFVQRLVYASSRRDSFVSLVIPFSFIVLGVTIALGHFWGHYVDLFSWYLAIFASDVLLGISRKVSSLIVRLKKLSRVSAGHLTTIGVLFIALGFGGAALAGKSFSLTHQLEAESKAIEDFMAQLVEEDRSFLAPHNMHAHWTLGESRHGFPHAANTGHILAGQWGGVESQGLFLAPTNLEDYCESLEESALEVIFLTPDSALNFCFEDSRESWVKESIGLTSGGSLITWIR